MLVGGRALRNNQPGTTNNQLSYDICDSPIGALMTVSTAGGVVRLVFEVEGFCLVREELSEHFAAPLVHDSAANATAIRQLAEYFASQRRKFNVPLDRSLSRGFRAEVQSFLATINYGETMHYSQVAAAMGNPGASRAVGSACATNPIPIFLPCHRVVRRDGSLGEFRAGPQAKATLLGLEAEAAIR